MAKRPVFMVSNNTPYYVEVDTEFKYYSGFAKSQKQLSSNSLRESFQKTHPNANVLEVSRYSDSHIGTQLSAFNLKITLKNGDQVPVENAFQSSKVFMNGEQHLDLLYKSPAEAKTDERIRNSGELKCFRFEGIEYPLIPRTSFYDWIYINALKENPTVCEEIMKYDAFTDIVFNPEKSINCQARAVAIFVSLVRTCKLEQATENIEAFKSMVYGDMERTSYQYSLF